MKLRKIKKDKKYQVKSKKRCIEILEELMLFNHNVLTLKDVETIEGREVIVVDTCIVTNDSIDGYYFADENFYQIKISLKCNDGLKTHWIPFQFLKEIKEIICN